VAGHEVGQEAGEVARHEENRRLKRWLDKK
jgi:hypothetical protein